MGEGLKKKKRQGRGVKKADLSKHNIRSTGQLSILKMIYYLKQRVIPKKKNCQLSLHKNALYQSKNSSHKRRGKKRTCLTLKPTTTNDPFYSSPQVHHYDGQKKKKKPFSYQLLQIGVISISKKCCKILLQASIPSHLPCHLDPQNVQ